MQNLMMIYLKTILRQLNCLVKKIKEVCRTIFGSAALAEPFLVLYGS